MAKKKYYAVRRGAVPGIYDTWDACASAVRGFPGAEYKGFAAKAEAEAWLAAEAVPSADGAFSAEAVPPAETAPSAPSAHPAPAGRRATGRPAARRRGGGSDAAAPGRDGGAPSLADCPPETVVAYVDGSFDAATGRYGYGCVLLTPAGEVIRANGSGDRPEARTARNVAGELLGAMYALRWTREQGYKKLILCHDYTGIALWYEGKWKAESYCAKKYLEFIRPYRREMEVTFRKIAAHTGVLYNEEADRLAKEALGLFREDPEAE